MEGKPTAKPSQESGPETRKRIIIKKNPPDCDSNVGGKERHGQTKGWGRKNTYMVLPYPKKVIQAFKKYTWNVRKRKDDM